MELVRLEKYKVQFKNFTKTIESLQSYLSSLNTGSIDAPIITPYVVSKKLNIPETDAFFILSLAEKESILHKKFQVWTENESFLGDYENTQSIPNEIFNQATGKKVDRDHFFVDVVFELEK
ncbi:hypothetical protein [Mucilaginibacter sp. 5C4]|uniref:hypothetical protein n=1 Tax=Mucilaginibacter sp. 5C4 TaxID=3048589 RepID=UPI002AC97371|nr:hypothetical protein [Mucilaginibacter sp. 5C4]MEB0301562.1 hypothetical protein [Mucilaginibacter sp. 5C4]WPX25313.1 hypothetical protein RHM67_08565 [Mucilaginibacter sp. 5C4]